MKVELIAKEKNPHHLYTYVCIIGLGYVSISEHSYSTGNYTLKEYYGLCFLTWGEMEPQDGFYSNDSLKANVSSSTKLPAVSKWGICCYLGLQLQGQPAPQTSWDGMGNKPSTAVFFLPALKELLSHPHLWFLFTIGVVILGGKSKSPMSMLGHCNHSYLASKPSLEKNAQVKY